MLHEHQLLLALPDEGGWPGEERSDEISAWRMRERMKTPSLVLVLALNIGVDPPDVTKPTPCARLECWLDPLAGPVAGQKAIDAIATALQQQYEQWQPRGTKTVRTCLDPTAQEVRKWCASLRRASPGRDERLLLHFNGHGVPRPTVNGEVWLFHRAPTPGAAGVDASSSLARSGSSTAPSRSTTPSRSSTCSRGSARRASSSLTATMRGG